MSAGGKVRLTIDGREVTVAAGTSVLQAAKGMGIEIPHFCYHPAFEAEGSCRMCLVEIEGLPKLELSCSTPVREGMVVRTSSPKVLESRRAVLELLLAEHPLDCPICDKAGECRLQEYYDRHGRFPGRFVEVRERREKRIELGRGLLLDRERCVLCTRCVRFLRKVTGTGELGVFERGVRAEIGTFDGRRLENDYSGNLVDICPVGAITDSDFRFKTRAWFLERRPTICPHCGRGCAVVVDSVSGYPLPEEGRKVFRIRAGENPAVNGWWICDIGRWSGRRFIEEGRQRRVLRPSAPDETLSWDKALAEVAASLRALPGPERAAKVGVILNSFLTCEELESARALFGSGPAPGTVLLVDPEPGRADGLLLTAERVPNGRGVREAGWTSHRDDLERLLDQADVLLIFGPYLAERFAREVLARRLARIKARFLWTAHETPLAELVDLVFPLAVPAEKSGSYINVDGLRQSFKRAVSPSAESLAEGEVFTRLAAALGAEARENVRA